MIIGSLCLVDKLLTITDLDPIRRYLAPCDRPKANSRYSSIQVRVSSRLFTRYSMDSIQDSSRYQYSLNISRSFMNQTIQVKKQATGLMTSTVSLFASYFDRRTVDRRFLQGTFSDLVIQIVAISESVRLQQVLATYGIQTQTPKQIEPLLIWPPAELVAVRLGFSEIDESLFLGLCKSRH